LANIKVYFRGKRVISANSLIYKGKKIFKIFKKTVDLCEKRHYIIYNRDGQYQIKGGEGEKKFKEGGRKAGIQIPSPHKENQPKGYIPPSGIWLRRLRPLKRISGFRI